ncbi:MAG: YegP family protein, partial [Pseudomonadota bacterium]
KFSFNLKSRNSQVVGTSQSYGTAASRDGGVKSVMNTAPGAAVDDTTA